MSNAFQCVRSEWSSEINVHLNSNVMKWVNSALAQMSEWVIEQIESRRVYKRRARSEKKKKNRDKAWKKSGPKVKWKVTSHPPLPPSNAASWVKLLTRPFAFGTGKIYYYVQALCTCQRNYQKHLQPIEGRKEGVKFAYLSPSAMDPSTLRVLTNYKEGMWSDNGGVLD